MGIRSPKRWQKNSALSRAYVRLVNAGQPFLIQLCEYIEYRLRCYTRQAHIVLGEEGYEATSLKSEQKSHIALLLKRLKQANLHAKPAYGNTIGLT
jgi:flagellar biosynthesis/type III secretory pathway chaperone